MFKLNCKTVITINLNAKKPLIKIFKVIEKLWLRVGLKLSRRFHSAQIELKNILLIKLFNSMFIKKMNQESLK